MRDENFDDQLLICACCGNMAKRYMKCCSTRMQHEICLDERKCSVHCGCKVPRFVDPTARQKKARQPEPEQPFLPFEEES